MTDTTGSVVKDEAEIGGGLSPKQARKLRMKSMAPEERSYLRRNAFAEKIWVVCRTAILCGISFVVLYPLIYMVSCAFRERQDMSDPTVMWIPRHFTLDIIRETIDAMDLWKTLRDTLVLNIGCSFVQVISCAVTGYGKFRGSRLLFGIVILMILVPTQIIAIPLYTLFRNFGIKGLFEINLINTPWTMYLPALTGNGIRSGLMILIFRQFFRGLYRRLRSLHDLRQGNDP